MDKIFKRSSVAMLMTVAVASLTGCHEDLDTYEGETGIYFDTMYKGGETLSDTITVAWGMKSSSETSQVIELNVKLLGHTAPVDRTFEIKVETAIMPDGSEMPVLPEPEPGMEPYVPTLDAEEGVDFVMPPTTYVLKAGEAEVKIPVTVLRSGSLSQAKRAFKLSLVEDENFKFLYSRVQAIAKEDSEVEYYPLDLQRVIVSNENFPIPAWWSYRGTPYFGTWTQKKASLICDVMGLDRERWLETDLSKAYSAGYLKFCGRYMHNWLQENPQKEDDGTDMVMGVQSQQ